jgi:integration host factor subunit beta
VRWPAKSESETLAQRDAEANFLPNKGVANSMTKADLVDEVAKVTELSRKDAEVIVETLFESIIKALKANDKLEVRGFGSFRIRERKARQGRNPKTGDKVSVPEKKVPYFKPSKELKDLINTPVAG